MEKNVAYPAAMVQSVQVRLGWAQAEFLTGDGDEVTALVAGDEDSVQSLVLRHENGKLLIEQPQYGLSLNLYAGHWMQVCVRVPSAWRGDIALFSVSGPLSIKHALGKAVTLDTVSGTVHADGLMCASLGLHAVTGAVQAVRVTGDALRMRNVSGDISVLEARFDNAHVTTVSGDITLHFTKPFAALEVRSATGDAHISLPGEKLETLFRSVAGRLRTEDFADGTDAPTLEASTVTGNVTVRKVAEDAHAAQ
ncbi:MAG: DUF4097 domain-containing protein [Oscillospiraceae bacterium]|jgi:hypothetical protein|nr:DUF4097 domain-containing protein [Oscillospiraceae bacterium]